LATTIVPGTAIQKIVDVSIKDAKTFSETVFFLELWPIEKATEKTIEVKDEGKKLTGAFELIQFKFDKNNNFIYTSRDINQKATYAGTASGFSISGLLAGAVIRIGKTNSVSDVIEQYNGPAESVEVKVELISKPEEGEIGTIYAVDSVLFDFQKDWKDTKRFDPKGAAVATNSDGSVTLTSDGLRANIYITGSSLSSENKPRQQRVMEWCGKAAALQKRGYWDSPNDFNNNIVITGKVSVGKALTGKSFTLELNSILHDEDYCSGLGGSGYHFTQELDGRVNHEKEQWHANYSKKTPSGKTFDVTKPFPFIHVIYEENNRHVHLETYDSAIQINKTLVAMKLMTLVR
jgi:hypothetical protein